MSLGKPIYILGEPELGSIHPSNGTSNSYVSSPHNRWIKAPDRKGELVKIWISKRSEESKQKGLPIHTRMASPFEGSHSI